MDWRPRASLLLLLFVTPVMGNMVARCPEEWVHRTATDQCYRFHAWGSRTFRGAKDYCSLYGGTLISINDTNTKGWLEIEVAETEEFEAHAPVWLGARKLDSEWVWDDSEEVIDSSVITWEDGGDEDADCAAFTENGKLIKKDCSTKLHFICSRDMNKPFKCKFSAGWEDVKDHCYKSSYPANGFNDALIECALDDANLVVIDDAAENQYVFDMAHRKYDSVWIGLTEESHAGSWEWVIQQQSDYSNWVPGANASLDGYGAAVISAYDEGQWTAEKVSESHNYVCEKPQGTCATGWEEFEEHCYYFNTENVDTVTWYTAEATCRSVGGYLVIVNSVEEDTFIRTTMAETDTLWLGLLSAPHDGFYWVDSTKLDYSQMDQGVEETALESDDTKCAYIRTNEDNHDLSEWIPDDCTETRHYLCEAEIDANITMIPPQDESFCPDSWLEYRGHCYSFGYEEETWATARSKCKESGGDLASITTWQEHDWIHIHTRGDSWIGLNDRKEDDKFEWSDGTKVTITNWNLGEPTGGTENCVEQKYLSGKWNDLDCNLKRNYVCKTHLSATPVQPTPPPPTPLPENNCGWNWIENPLTGECIRLMTDELLSFHDANDICKELEHDGETRPTLVTINTAQDALFLQTYLITQHFSNPTLWIGLQNDLDGMRWVDGSPVQYTNWNSGEPNKKYNENCIEMYTDSYKWNDVVCNERRGFICEKKGPSYVTPTPPPKPDVQCPEDWKSWDNFCYYFSTTPATWDDAHTYCQSNYASILASIKNKDENDFIHKMMQYNNDRTWVGLHDDDKGGHWHWADDSEFIYYRNWNTGEPNNDKGQEHCGEMLSETNGKWNDAPCSDKNNFVCKITVRTCPEGWTFNKNKCYYASNFPETGSAAQDRCREMNSQADLVSLHSDEENAFFHSLLDSSTPGTWIGLLYQFHTGGWVWTDKSDSSYTNWNEGEPNNIGVEFCVETIAYSGYWNNLHCGESRNFGCQVIPTHIVGCEPDWVYAEGYCYYFNYNSATNDQLKNFEDSQKECQNLGSNLVSIHSKEENDIVMSMLEGYYESGGVWIGLRNGESGGASWVDGSPVTFTAWDTESSYSQYPCTYMNPFSFDGLWEKDQCSSVRYYFCKKAPETRPIESLDDSCDKGDIPYKASCYKTPGLQHNWQDAEGVCKTFGGHLVVINDRFEGALLSAILMHLESTAWIGLSGKTSVGSGMQFNWVNGDPVKFVNWDEYEPETSHGSCAIASGDSPKSGLWRVEDCKENHQYVCEYDRTGYTLPPPPTTTPAPKYCRDGWERYEDKCYKLFLDPTTWGKGEEICATYGGHLTSIANGKEKHFLERLDGVFGIPDRLMAIWIGLSMPSDQSGYKWSDDSALSYLNWATGQPDSHYGRERCVGAKKNTFQYNDYVCDSYKPFICKTPEGLAESTTSAPATPTPDVFCEDDRNWLLFSDNCYKIYPASDGLTSWSEANDKCISEGSHLASIHSYEENYWLLSKTYKMPDRMLWSGGRAFYDEGFSWTDGTPFDFENWAVGEPNNHNDQEECMTIYSFDNGYWNDMNCGNRLGRICKRPHGTILTPPPPTPPPQGECPPGWVRLRGKCYFFSGSNVTEPFTRARDKCKELNPKADLASVHSEAQSGFMALLAGSDTESVWLGLRKEGGVFVWADNSVVDFTNWAPGEPNGEDHNWGYDCVMMAGRNGAWSDGSCYSSNSYICKVTVDPAISTPAPMPVCDAPYDLYESLYDNCYIFISEPMSWQDAENTCKNDGAHLVSVQDLAINSYLWAVMDNLEIKQEAWIGLNSLEAMDELVWTDGWPTVYTHWGSGQPNVTVKNHRCTSISPEQGLWSMQNCNESRPFFCMYSEVPPPTPDPPVEGSCPDSSWKNFGGGFCYLVVDEQKTWSDANWQCMQENSDLVSVHSEQEKDLLLKATNHIRDPIWLGLVQQKEKSFSWTDGTPMDFVYWGEGEPNDNSEMCAEMYTSGGNWNDAECSSIRSFVCKTPKIRPTKPPTDPSPPQTTEGSTLWAPSGLNAGGIVGIVISCMFVVVAAGFISHQYLNRPKPIGSNGSFGIDNALYTARDGAEHVTVSPTIEKATSVEEDSSDADLGGVDLGSPFGDAEA